MTATSDRSARPASEFLARAGHELRTPLNAILGMLELSLSEPLPATLRDYLTTARDSARTLTVSLDDVLDLAQAGVSGCHGGSSFLFYFPTIEACPA